MTRGHTSGDVVVSPGLVPLTTDTVLGGKPGLRHWNWGALGFLMIVVLWGVAAYGLKLQAANAGAYTSDLYDYHTALRNTVEGDFFRSYVYGNLMGDHGYLILLLLLPAYWLAPSGSFWLLVVAAPVVVVASAVAVRSILVQRGQQYPNLKAAALLSIPGMFWLVHEPIYGFHPDTLAGPLLIVAVIGLGGWGSHPSDTGNRLGIAAFVLFVLLKEEMALLGLIFAIPFIIRPASRRLGVGLIVVASAVSTAAFTLMAMTRTPFNRGNETLIGTAVDRLTIEQGLAAAIGVGLPLVAAIALVAVVLGCRRRLSAADLAVAMVAAAKVASLGLVYDQIPSYSWHLAIPLAGVWYALYRIGSTPLSRQPRHTAWTIAATTMILIIGVALVDLRWYLDYALVVRDRSANMVSAHEAANSFSPIVGDRVVSVPPFDVHAWRDREVTMFPRGLTMSPRGISDAVVIETDGLSPELRSALACFALRETTASRQLYLRSADCGLDADRELFDEVAGLP